MNDEHDNVGLQLSGHLGPECACANVLKQDATSTLPMWVWKPWTTDNNLQNKVAVRFKVQFHNRGSRVRNVVEKNSVVGGSD